VKSSIINRLKSLMIDCGVVSSNSSTTRWSCPAPPSHHRHLCPPTACSNHPCSRRRWCPLLAKDDRRVFMTTTMIVLRSISTRGANYHILRIHTMPCPRSPSDSPQPLDRAAHPVGDLGCDQGGTTSRGNAQPSTKHGVIRAVERDPRV
jgi:hypothetical protein